MQKGKFYKEMLAQLQKSFKQSGIYKLVFSAFLGNVSELGAETEIRKQQSNYELGKSEDKGRVLVIHKSAYKHKEKGF